MAFCIKKYAENMPKHLRPRQCANTPVLHTNLHGVVP